MRAASNTSSTDAPWRAVAAAYLASKRGRGTTERAAWALLHVAPDSLGLSEVPSLDQVHDMRVALQRIHLLHELETGGHAW